MFRFIGFVILLILVYMMDGVEFIGLIKKINLKYFLLSVFLFPILVFLKVLRWKYLLAIQGIRYSLKSAFIAYCTSILLGVITPGRIGEFSRALYLKDDVKVPFSMGIPSIFMDRFLDICVLLIIGIISLLFLPGKIKEIFTISILSIILVVIGFIFTMLYGKTPFKSFLNIVEKIPFLKTTINNLYQVIKKLHFYLMQLFSIKLIFPIILSIINISLFFIITILIGKAGNIPNQYLPIIIPTIVLANIIGLLPITVSGIGTRDAIFTLVFSVVGMNNPFENAVFFSFCFILVFSGLSVLLGSITWFIKPINVNTLKMKIRSIY